MFISDDLSYTDLFSLLEKPQEKLGREINPTFYSEEGWVNKINGKNNFVLQIIKQPKIFLIGNADEFSEFGNLVKTGAIKVEDYDENEFQGYLRSGEARLKDALIESLSPESRFDLAYNAAHSLALAALRKKGYRPSKNRYIVFQALPHTLNFGQEWRVLAKCHEQQNLAEYEGFFEIDDRLLNELISITKKLFKLVSK